MSLVDRYVDRLLSDIGVRNSDAQADRMRDVALRHAERLRELGPVRVCALDPCPRCGGNVIATTTVAKCTRCDTTIRRVVL